MYLIISTCLNQFIQIYKEDYNWLAYPKYRIYLNFKNRGSSMLTVKS